MSSIVPRFELKSLEDIKDFLDPNEVSDLEGYEKWSYIEFLWDNRKQEVAFERFNTEPEDATLDRSFQPLIDLLNEVANESS